MGITTRYVGEEPRSLVTGIYNEIMQKELPIHGIRCVVIPRKEWNGEVISASTVRKALQEENWNLLENLVPETTYRYFKSSEATPLVARIRAAGNVIHY